MALFFDTPASQQSGRDAPRIREEMRYKSVANEQEIDMIGKTTSSSLTPLRDRKIAIWVRKRLITSVGLFHVSISLLPHLHLAGTFGDVGGDQCRFIQFVPPVSQGWTCADITFAQTLSYHSRHFTSSLTCRLST